MYVMLDTSSKHRLCPAVSNHRTSVSAHRGPTMDSSFQDEGRGSDHQPDGDGELPWSLAVSVSFACFYYWLFDDGANNNKMMVMMMMKKSAMSAWPSVPRVWPSVYVAVSSAYCTTGIEQWGASHRRPLARLWFVFLKRPDVKLLWLCWRCQSGGLVTAFN